MEIKPRPTIIDIHGDVLGKDWEKQEIRQKTKDFSGKKLRNGLPNDR